MLDKLTDELPTSFQLQNLDNISIDAQYQYQNYAVINTGDNISDRMRGNKILRLEFIGSILGVMFTVGVNEHDGPRLSSRQDRQRFP